MTGIKAGQIWREVDPRHPRHPRYVRIIDDSTLKNHVRITTVVKEGEAWVASSDRLTLANRKRFNGKRGGYQFVEDGQ